MIHIEFKIVFGVLVCPLLLHLNSQAMNWAAFVSTVCTTVCQRSCHAANSLKNGPRAVSSLSAECGTLAMPLPDSRCNCVPRHVKQTLYIKGNGLHNSKSGLYVEKEKNQNADVSMFAGMKNPDKKLKLPQDSITMETINLERNFKDYCAYVKFMSEDTIQPNRAATSLKDCSECTYSVSTRVALSAGCTMLAEPLRKFRSDSVVRRSVQREEKPYSLIMDMINPNFDWKGLHENNKLLLAPKKQPMTIFAPNIPEDQSSSCIEQSDLFQVC